MQRAAAVSAVIAGVALGLAPVIEFAGTNRGDPDNADESLAFLHESAYRFGLSGFALVVAGVALIIAVLGFAQHLSRNGALDLWLLTFSTLAVIGGASYLMAGIVRHTSHGTIGYVEEMNRDWAEAAYLSVHMTGTQAMLPLGAHLLAAWLIGVALVAHREGARARSLVGVLPALLLLLFVVDALTPGADDSAALGVVWVGYIVTMFLALPLSLVVLGVAWLRSGDGLSTGSVHAPGRRTA